MGMRKILVTGAAGFIGSHITDALLEAGHEVVGFDNLSNGKLRNIHSARASNRFQFIEGDICNAEEVNAAIKGIEVVYHMACLGVRHSLHSPLENHRVNAEGSLRVLEAARQENVSKFFYISTSEIYGDIQTFPIDELGVPAPKTVYGSSKLAGENYAYSYNVCYGLPTVITRIFNNYGPRAHYEGDAGEIIPRSIVRMLNGEAPVVFGKGDVTRDFFFVKDTARALVQLMNNEKVVGEIINIGTGTEITMKELMEVLIEEMGLKDRMNIRFEEDRPADVPRLWVNPTKFKALTNFSGEKEFREGLRETISYYRELNQQHDLMGEIELQNWKK
jgi:UDP-glucose 4-epimerase